MLGAQKEQEKIDFGIALTHLSNHGHADAPVGDAELVDFLSARQDEDAPAASFRISPGDQQRPRIKALAGGHEHTEWAYCSSPSNLCSVKAGSDFASADLLEFAVLPSEENPSKQVSMRLLQRTVVPLAPDADRSPYVEPDATFASFQELTGTNRGFDFPLAPLIGGEGRTSGEQAKCVGDGDGFDGGIACSCGAESESAAGQLELETFPYQRTIFSQWWQLFKDTAKTGLFSDDERRCRFSLENVRERVPSAYALMAAAVVREVYYPSNLRSGGAQVFAGSSRSSSSSSTSSDYSDDTFSGGPIRPTLVLLHAGTFRGSHKTLSGANVQESVFTYEDLLSILPYDDRLVILRDVPSQHLTPIVADDRPENLADAGSSEFLLCMAVEWVGSRSGAPGRGNNNKSTSQPDEAGGHEQAGPLLQTCSGALEASSAVDVVTLRSYVTGDLSVRGLTAFRSWFFPTHADSVDGAGARTASTSTFPLLRDAVASFFLRPVLGRVEILQRVRQEQDESLVVVRRAVRRDLFLAFRQHFLGFSATRRAADEDDTSGPHAVPPHDKFAQNATEFALRTYHLPSTSRGERDITSSEVRAGVGGAGRARAEEDDVLDWSSLLCFAAEDVISLSFAAAGACRPALAAAEIAFPTPVLEF